MKLTFKTMVHKFIWIAIFTKFYKIKTFIAVFYDNNNNNVSLFSATFQNWKQIINYFQTKMKVKDTTNGNSTESFKEQLN